ncbi:MAG TPA: DNA polymerase III subunit beta [Alphaproteobacteria bacterium]|jgi:DNA polymerase-3 subunit beta|nr:DNA polymerase III subunit beta [Alphaproteobacteria bacterium]
MKLQILQENLQKAINITSRFASSKAQLPILGNILLSAQKAKVFVSSTNLEISASVQIGAKIEKEGEISVPAKIILDLISNLPKETIDLELKQEQLKISTSSFSSNVLGMNSSDFPKIPSSVDEENSIQLPKKEFSDSLSQVVFAASLDESRPVLTGVLFIWEQDYLVLVATDGFRLSQKRLSLITQNKKQIAQKIVIPKNILNEIGRLVEEDGNILFDFQEKEKQVIFGNGNVILSSRLLEGEYPDFEKIIPKSSTLKVLADKEELLRAVKLASIFARDAGNIVKFNIMEDHIKITAESGSAGSQEARVDVKVEGFTSDFEISFNYKFVEDFLHSVVGEEIKVEFSTIDKAGVFTDPKDKNYLHLIMPVKV